MIWRIIAVVAIVTLVGTLGAAPPAEAGFWGDLKRSFGAAVDDAEREGAKAVDAVVEGAESAADYVAGDSTNADSQSVDDMAEPVADRSKQLTKQPKK